jgi:hypothetical protein
MEPFIYYHAPTNSAQLVYPIHIGLPDLPELSLCHSEDKRNPASNALEVHLQKQGIVLMLLDNLGRLTGEVYILENGELVKCTELKVTLSEAFAPKPNHICEVPNIKLADYLDSQ